MKTQTQACYTNLCDTKKNNPKHPPPLQYQQNNTNL